MKNKMLWIGSVIILFLSVICFVVFGVGTEIIKAVTGMGEGPVFGKYDGKPITMTPGSEFANAVHNYTNYYQQQGTELNETTNFYIYTDAFNYAVQSIAAKSEVAKAGYKPGKSSISRVMLPSFSDANGNFDPKIYNSISESDRNAFKESVAANLTATRFTEDFFGSAEKIGGKSLFGAKTPSKENDFLTKIGSEKRSFDIVSYNKLDYPASEATAFGKDHSDLFNKYSLSVITFNDETTAKKVASQIAKNEITFEDAVTSYSEKYYSNGTGKIIEDYEYQIKENIENADDFSKITALEKNAISPVIKTVKGYSVYRNDGEKKSPDFTDEVFIGGAKTYISEKEAGRIEDYFLGKANNFIAKATVDGFTKAATKEGLTVTSVPAFPLNYGDVSIADKIPTENIKEFTYANSSENLLTKAFSLKLNEIAEPVVLGNFIIVMKLTGTQTEPVTTEQKDKIATAVIRFDQEDAQSTLLTSKKVENNVTTVYFNQILGQQ